VTFRHTLKKIRGVYRWKSEERRQQIETRTIECNLEGALGKARFLFEPQLGGEHEDSVRSASPPLETRGTLVLEPGGTLTLNAGPAFLEGIESGELVLFRSILPNLEGSLYSLLKYPYGLAEQTTSKLIPWIALRNYLPSIDSDSYSVDQIRDHIRAGVERLLSMQTGDGGLGYWPGALRSHPWASVYAAHALLEALTAGYSVPEKRFDRLLDYVDGLLARPRFEDARRAGTVRAYALAVLARADRVRMGWIETLGERRDELTVEARACWM
jgi:uncharacterized protein YfaS (alpha-2-macroglobulin family)